MVQGGEVVCFHVDLAKGEVEGTIVVKRNVEVFNQAILVCEIAEGWLTKFLFFNLKYWRV